MTRSSIKPITQRESSASRHVDDPVYLGYSHAQLKAAFDHVTRGMDDWRGKIDVTHRSLDHTVHACCAAITYFTGTIPSLHWDPTGIGNVRIKSVGYRKGPCGP